MPKQLDKDTALSLFGNTDAGKAALGKISPGEVGYGLAGGLVGGAGGWLLSKLLHRGPSTRLKLLYTLLGATAGAGGTEYALSHIGGGDGFDGSMRDRLRLSTAFRKALSNDTEGSPKQPRKVPADMVNMARLKASLKAEGAIGGGLGLLAGGWIGAADHGIDFSGLRAARKLVNDQGLNAQTANGALKYTTRSTDPDSWTQNNELAGNKLIRKSIDNGKGEVAHSKVQGGGFNYDFNPGTLARLKANAVDIAGNAAVGTAVGLGTGTLAGYIRRLAMADRPDYHKMLDINTYTP